jgi:hypothetical protein
MADFFIVSKRMNRCPQIGTPLSHSATSLKTAKSAERDFLLKSSRTLARGVLLTPDSRLLTSVFGSRRFQVKRSRPVSGNPDGPRLSWYKPNSVSAFARWRSFISLGFLSARQQGAGCDYYPRASSCFRGKTSGQLHPLFVLHHMGFFVRSRLREDPVGSYPAVSPLPRPTFRPGQGWGSNLKQA